MVCVNQVFVKYTSYDLILMATRILISYLNSTRIRLGVIFLCNPCLVSQKSQDHDCKTYKLTKPRQAHFQSLFGDSGLMLTNFGHFQSPMMLSEAYFFKPILTSSLQLLDLCDFFFIYIWTQSHASRCLILCIKKKEASLCKKPEFMMFTKNRKF